MAKTIPLTNSDEVMIVDDEDYEELSRYRWYRCHGGYAHRSLKVHHVVLDVDGRLPPGMVVDHVDRNRLNNTKSNLRVVTSQQNCFNRVPPKRGGKTAATYKGVARLARARREIWSAHISVNRNRLYIGSFYSELEAAIAYDNAARELHGVCALLNFPETDHRANPPEPISKSDRRLRSMYHGSKGVCRYKGVCIRKNGKYRAMCARKGLGTFNTAIEAALAYDKAALSYYGPGCYLNFPDGPPKEAEELKEPEAAE